LRYTSAKRLLDLSLASVGLLLSAPVLFGVAALIRLTSPGGAIFRQERVGLNGRPFRILKFRTMLIGISGPAITRAGDPRVTPVGRWLRRYKLDELPQLLNVLVGDMSIVGPRPEVGPYVDLYREQYRKILSVRPGLTDFATIVFRNEERTLADSADPERMYVEEILPRKIELYLRYVAEMSFATDIRLIAATLRALAR
jgi:lipopolysaccharide/colanic/teichoic acid biosynthesis glycosyltransferase